MKRGLFITMEGPEGSGKTTHAHRLIARLEARGLQVMYTREPGGTPTGETIRDILQYDKAGEPICPETEMLLFSASRAQLVRHVILPALEQGSWVVCDRFFDSTTAYQGYGRGFPMEHVLAINAFAVGPAIPDRTLLLDVPVERGFERLQARYADSDAQRDRIEMEALSFHRRVREGYLELARRETGRFRMIDADREPDAVEESVWKHVRELIDG